MDDNTKLRRQFLDLCKPLIDLNSEGIVSIVHLSAKQYILDTASGPFLTSQQGLRDVSLACTAYVEFSLNLVDERIPETERMESIAKRFHNLHAFAYPHWLDYLVQLAESEDGLQPTAELEDTILKLCARHRHLSKVWERQPSLTSNTRSDTRVALFAQCEPLCMLAADFWEAEQRLHEKQQKGGVDENGEAHQADPTLLNTVNTQYQSMVEKLLTANSELDFPELAQHIPHFRSLYVVKPFTCKYPQCSWRSEGFATNLERLEHEQSHQPRHMCSEVSCPFATSIGFRTRLQLRKHIRDHHGGTHFPIFTKYRTLVSEDNEKSNFGGWKFGVSREASNEFSPSRAPYEQEELKAIGDNLGALELERLPPHYTVVANDWHAIFNPTIERVVDVNLVHTIPHQDAVLCVCFSNDGSLIATGSLGGAAIFSVDSGLKVSRLVHSDRSGKDLYISDVSFRPDGSYLATGGGDEIIRIWHVFSGAMTGELVGHDHDIFCLQWSQDARWIVSGDSDNTVRVWEAQFLKLIYAITFQARVTSVALSPDSRIVAVGVMDKSIRLYNITNGFAVGWISGHSEDVYKVAFAPDGETLASWSFDETLKLWDFPMRKCLRTLRGHGGFVSGGKFTADGSMVLSASNDRSVQVWDAKTGAARMRLTGHQDWVMCIDCSPQGTYFATVSKDMTAKIWKLTEYKELTT